MITPSIYSQSEAQIANDLLPPLRRFTKFKTWLTVLLSPIQWLHDLIFTDYYAGSSAVLWVTGTNYVYGDRVKDTDYKIYELMTVAGLTPSTVAPHFDPTNWVQVLDTFVGVGERIKYTGQRIILEYVLNKYFSVGSTALPWINGTNPSHSTQIFITEGTIFTGFWLTNTNNILTGYMSNANSAQKFFMANSPTFNPNTFIIHVPTAVDAAITANQVSGVTAEDVIRSVADKYVQAGKLYSYVTY